MDGGSFALQHQAAKDRGGGGGGMNGLVYSNPVAATAIVVVATVITTVLEIVSVSVRGGVLIDGSSIYTNGCWQVKG